MQISPLPASLRCSRRQQIKSSAARRFVRTSLTLNMWEAVEVGTQTDLHQSSDDFPAVEEISYSPRVPAQSQVLELNVGGALLSAAHATLMQVWTYELKVARVTACVLLATATSYTKPQHTFSCCWVSPAAAVSFTYVKQWTLTMLGSGFGILPGFHIQWQLGEQPGA